MCVFPRNKKCNQHHNKKIYYVRDRQKWKRTTWKKFSWGEFSALAADSHKPQKKKIERARDDTPPRLDHGTLPRITNQSAASGPWAAAHFEAGEYIYTLVCDDLDGLLRKSIGFDVFMAEILCMQIIIIK